MADHTASLPLNSFCRNARLSLKKAAFCKKSHLPHDELSHLLQFQSLVSSHIPHHPSFPEKQHDKQIVELQFCLVDTRKRIQQLQSDLQQLSSSTSFKGSTSASPRSKTPLRSPRLSPEYTPSNAHKAQKKPRSMAKKPDSPKKHQSWGIWTANPHETQGSLGFGSLSPPSKRHISRMQKGKKVEASFAEEFKNLPSSNTKEAFVSSPLRSSSPDQRLEAILGGCTLLANQLNSFEDGMDGHNPQRSGPVIPVNGWTPARKSPSMQMGSMSKRSHQSSIEWLPGRSKTPLNDEGSEFAECSKMEDDNMKSTEKVRVGDRGFRFASHFFGRRLQERMNRLKLQSLDTEDDGSGSPPAKVRASSDKRSDETLQDQGSSEESLPDDENSSSALDMFTKHLSSGLDTCGISGRLQRLSMGEGESIERNQMASTSDLWARKLVPAVEQKLAHEMLCPQGSPPKTITRSIRKKSRKVSVLGVMDDVIRHAVDSDSGVSNVTSPRHSGSCQENVMEISTRGFRGLQKAITQGSLVEKRSETASAQQRQHSLQGLQVEALEEKINSLQNLVGDLKRSIEGFTSRAEEEGDTWQCKMEGLEKELQIWREETENELMGIKGSIKEELQFKLDELTRGLGKRDRLLTETESNMENSKQKMESKMEDCSSKVEFLREQLDSLVADVKTVVVAELADKVTETVQDVSDGFKSDLDVLEVGISKDFDSLRKEMESKFETLRTESEKCRKSDMRQIEAMLDEKIEGRLSQRLEIVSGGKEKVIADMKTELRLLWAEVDLLSKGRETIKENMEQLTQIAENAKESIGREQDQLKSENGSLRKQLQYFKKESMQSKIETEDFKKDIEMEVDDIKSSVGMLKDEGEEMRASIERLKKVEDDLTVENKNLRKLLDRMRDDEAARRVESESLKKATEEFEKVKGSSKVEGSRDRMLIMEKVESLSHLYLGGLEDLRGELLNMKLAYQDRMEELELHWEDLRRQQENNASSGNSLRELVLDGLETRLSHLEHKIDHKEDFEEERFKLDSTLAILEKSREQASSAASHAAAAAQKADELVTEMLAAFTSELANMKRKNMKIQENLASERDTAAAAACEVKRMSEDVEREKEMTMKVLLEVKMMGLQMQEGMEKERSVLKGSMIVAEKEKQAAIAAALDAASAAAKAEEALSEICKTQKESFSMSEDISETLEQAHLKYSKELESQIEAWRKSMVDEVMKARSLVEGIEEEKRRLSFSQCDEKSVLQDDFDHHMKQTEDAIADLARDVKEIRDSFDAESERTALSERQDNIMKYEITTLREKMEEVFERLDSLPQSNSTDAAKADGEMHETDEILRQDICNLERRLKETAAGQSNIVEKVSECWKKVKKLENVQMTTVRSVEEVQTKTRDLEKSANAWLQKYDGAARLLQELETRTVALENAFGREDDINADQKMDQLENSGEIAPAKKERIFSLYRKLSGFVRRMRIYEGRQEDDNKCASDSAEWTETSLAGPLDTRLVNVENRIEHLESDSLSNLRILEAKMEDFSIGVQTALEGASMAESKCTALGAELVKVFRMLASSRKESPTKMMMMMVDVADESNEQQHQHSRSGRPNHHKSETPTTGVKAKAASSHGACAYCKRAAMKGSGDIVEGVKDTSELGLRDSQHHPATHDHYNAEGHKSSHHFQEEQSPKLDRGFKECALHGKSFPDLHKQDSFDTHSRPHGGDASPTAKLSRRHSDKQQNEKDPCGKIEEPQDHMTKRNTSDIKAFEGKLPITQERFQEDKRVECVRKESTQLSSGKDCHLTNIKLEAGKIHVNVSHRSAATMAARLVKRGDAVPIHP